MTGGRRLEEGGGRRERPGYRIKNKNPTQSCGEQLSYIKTDSVPPILEVVRYSPSGPWSSRAAMA